MKFLHTADWHAGKTLRNRSRIDELKGCILEMAAIASSEQVDFVIVAGDLFDTTTPSPEAEHVVYRGLLGLAETGAEIVIIAGNHDSPARLMAVAPLLNQVRVRTGSHIVKAAEGGLLRLKSKAGENADIALLPFISQRNAVKAGELMELDASQYTVQYANICGRIIEGLCADMDQDAVRIAVAHLHISGGTLGGGERLAHSVDEYHVPAQVFPRDLHYVALGHLHAPQQIPGPCPVCYSGSPLQLDFGEVETKNSVCIINASPEAPAETRRIELRSGRKLKTLRGSLESLRTSASADEDCYLKLELDDPPVVGLADRARELFPNAVEVKVKTPSPASCEEDPDHSALSHHQLFQLYLTEQGEKDPQLMEEFKVLVEEAYETQEA